MGRMQIRMKTRQLWKEVVSDSSNDNSGSREECKSTGWRGVR